MSHQGSPLKLVQIKEQSIVKIQISQNQGWKIKLFYFKIKNYLKMKVVSWLLEGLSRMNFSVFLRATGSLVFISLWHLLHLPAPPYCFDWQCLFISHVAKPGHHTRVCMTFQCWQLLSSALDSDSTKIENLNGSPWLDVFPGHELWLWGGLM